MLALRRGNLRISTSKDIIHLKPYECHCSKLTKECDVNLLLKESNNAFLETNNDINFHVILFYIMRHISAKESLETRFFYRNVVIKKGFA